MNNSERIIKIVRTSPGGVCLIKDILRECHKKDINIDKRKLLTGYVRKTLFLDKPEKYVDIIRYVSNPELPIQYDDLVYNIEEPCCMEELFFLYVHREQTVPSLDLFRIYYESTLYRFRFNWHNRNTFHSMRKKILKMMRECGAF